MDNEIKYVVKVQNEEEIKKLTAYIEKQDDAIRDLNVQLTKGTLNQQQFAAAARPLAANAQQAAQQIAGLKSAAGISGQGLMQLGYAVDDLQYGFGAIVNNIPQIVASLGGSAGIAGAVAIAGVGINTLVNHWGELSDLLKSAWTGDSLEQLHALREAAEETAKTYEKLAKTPTEAEAKGAAAIHKANVEDKKVIEQGLTTAIENSPMRAKLSEVMKVLPGGGSDAEMKAATEQVNRQKARDLLAQMESSNPAVAAAAKANAANLAKQNPTLFPAGYEETVRKSDPAAIKAAEEAAKQQALEAKGLENARKMRKEMAADEKKEKEHQIEMEMKGRENAKRFDKEQAAERRHQQMDVISDWEETIGKQQRQIREQPKAQLFGDARSYLSAVQVSAANTPEAQMLKTLDKQLDELKEIRKRMTREARAG